MGVDLRLLPLDYWNEERRWGYSHTVLPLPRNREAWKAFEKRLKVEEIGEADISTHVTGRVQNGDSEGESMYGALPKTDSYDCAYTWAKASDLLVLLKEFFPTHPTTAYVRALAPDALVVLDWH